MIIRGVLYAFLITGFADYLTGSFKVDYCPKNEIIISASLLSTQVERQCMIRASFLESVRVISKKHVSMWQNDGSITFSSNHCIPLKSNATGLWMSLLLLKCMDVESNPGPLTRSNRDGASASAEEKSNDATEQSTASKSANLDNDFQYVKDCQFFGAPGRNCSNRRCPGQTMLLRTMVDFVDDKNLKFPTNFAERDLIHNRMICDHADVPIYHDTKLCSEDRFRLGVGYVIERKGRKEWCKWKSHNSIADRLTTYPISWQATNPEGKKMAIGTPICRRCFSDAKSNVNEDTAYNCQYYEQEKVIWETALAAPLLLQLPQPAQPQILTPMGSRRIAGMIAETKIHEYYGKPPGSAGSGESSQQSIAVNSPIYVLSQGKDRLETLNKAMREIAGLSGRQWENVPFQLSKSLEDTSDRNARLITNVTASACMAVCNAIAPGQEKKLFRKVAEQMATKDPVEARHNDPILESIIDAIENVLGINQRVTLLSQICDNYTLSQLKAMSPCITDYLIKLARNHKEEMGAGMPVKKKTIVRHRLDMQKVSHFFNWIFEHGYIQLMSWGTLKMDFNSGETVEFGKLVLSNCRSQLIRLYEQDCKATMESDELLPERTLFKVLEQVKFSERRSMSGLDYVACAAMEGWKSLQEIVTSLERCEMRKERANELMAALKSSKNYLKGEYLIHVAPETSNCPHHCRRLALSDPKFRQLRMLCDDHEHDETCADCELIYSTLGAIEQEIDLANISEEQKREMKHDFEIASAAVLEQKAHIIRGVHQDQARKAIISGLDNYSGFLIFDYGMKFLPLHYREGQSNFFGKKGISNLLFSFLTRINGELVRTTYAAFISKCEQNAATSAAIYRYVLQQIKTDFPQITKIWDKSDNAGCFRNWKMLRERKRIMDEVGIQILQTHNNESQRGKDQADRDAAMIKSQLRAYHNSGGDIITASDMKKACDVGRLQSVKTAVVAGHLNKPALNKEDLPHGPPITSLYSYQYEEEGIRVWHFKNIGTGYFVPYEEMPSISENQRSLLVHEPFPESMPTPSAIKTNSSSAGESGTVWLHCDYPYCKEKFLSIIRYEEHITHFDHSNITMKPTTSDRVKRLWLHVQEDNETIAAARSGASAFLTSTNDDVSDPCYEGFALKVRRSPRRLNEKQKAYLSKLFWSGQLGSTPKAIPELVEKEMRQLRDGTQAKMFTPKEWLSQAEIQRFFSKLAAGVKSGKIQKPTDVVAEEAEDDERLEEQVESDEALAEAMDAATAFRSIQEVLWLEGTLALDAGDYCGIKSTDGWKAAKVIQVEDSNKMLEVQILESGTTPNAFFETRENERIILQAEDVITQLPHPNNTLTIRKINGISKCQDTLSFPEEICASLDQAASSAVTAYEDDQPSTSTATEPKRSSQLAQAKSMRPANI